MPARELPLGGLSLNRFLKHYWQKKPLLVRAAFPGFIGPLSMSDLFQTACRDDAEARMVSVRGNAQWKLARGPFSPVDFERKGRWTVLVQGVNLFVPAADRLLRKFAFLPYARLDDLMVSYATDGGGVGPHLDNYDVFLLQGMGRRRWRIGRVYDRSVHEDLPLSILKNFQPTEEWVLEPGDMLYLPPQWAHEGTAVGPCMTYSIGFRASPMQELGESFLNFLQDNLALAGRYRDPDLQPQKHAAEIGKAMIAQVSDSLRAIRWTPSTVRDFLGCHLTDPKPNVYFDPPSNPMSRARFGELAKRQGLRLDLRTQLLFAGSRFYINGAIAEGVPRSARNSFRMLADRRETSCLSELDEAAIDRLFQWYLDGFLEPR